MILPSEGRLRADLRRTVEECGEEPTPGAIGVMVAHLGLLARWNDRYHLTTITEWSALLDRHVRESVWPLRWIEPRGDLVDVGTGNGFPALPILACRPDLAATLVERSARKVLFLDTVLRAAKRDRVEIAARNVRSRTDARRLGTFDVVTSRATLIPSRSLPIALALAKPGGRIVLWTTSAAREIWEKNEWLSAVRILEEGVLPGRTDSRVYVMERRAIG